jgi:hypothetical protein
MRGTDGSHTHCSETRITKPLPIARKLGEDVFTSKEKTEMHTQQELQALTVDQLIEIYIQMGLRSSRMNKHFIVKDWLIEDILRGAGI